MHDLESQRLSAIPTAAGTITRLAYERAQAAGIELEPLLKKAGLTQQEVEDVDARGAVRWLVGIEGGVVSGVINIESPGV